MSRIYSRLTDVCNMHVGYTAAYCLLYTKACHTNALEIKYAPNIPSRENTSSFNAKPWVVATTRHGEMSVASGKTCQIKFTELHVNYSLFCLVQTASNRHCCKR